MYVALKPTTKFIISRKLRKVAYIIQNHFLLTKRNAMSFLVIHPPSFVKDFRKTDDYMGRAFLSLWSLGEHVEGKEMILLSHSGKTRYGSIIVDLSIEQVKKNTPVEVRECFIDLTKSSSLTEPLELWKTTMKSCVHTYVLSTLAYIPSVTLPVAHGYITI